MAALKEVRQRIKAVRGIEQVTKAMKMVATVKVKRVQDRLLQMRPYVDALYAMAGRLAAAPSGTDGAPAHDLLTTGAGTGEAVVVIGSDRGLCGAFNTALARHVVHQTADPRPQLVVVGKKPKAIFARSRRFEVAKTYEAIPFPVDWNFAERMARELLTLSAFLSLGTIRIAYQRFVKPGISRPAIIPWLPFTPDKAAATLVGPLNCEPSVHAVLDLVLPRALTAQLHRALLESQASEQGARMVAMENASTNAEELAGDLTLLSFKLRQSGITKELLEITTGAEALNA